MWNIFKYFALLLLINSSFDIIIEFLYAIFFLPFTNFNYYISLKIDAWSLFGSVTSDCDWNFIYLISINISNLKTIWKINKDNKINKSGVLICYVYINNSLLTQNSCGMEANFSRSPLSQHSEDLATQEEFECCRCCHGN